jgi:hypothetical protein
MQSLQDYLKNHHQENNSIDKSNLDNREGSIRRLSLVSFEKPKDGNSGGKQIYT